MAGNPLTDPTWATDVADSIERVVGTVRETVTNRVILVLRGAIFGIIIGIALTVGSAYVADSMAGAGAARARI